MSSIDKIAVGKRIKKIRIESFENKLTQTEFGQLIIPPVKKSSVRNWESGDNLPSSDRLKQIALLGNISTDYLLIGKEKIGYGNIIRQIRKENDLSKEDLAKQLNKDINYIENIELENKFPTKKEFIILANIGNMTWEKILWSE